MKKNDRVKINSYDYKGIGIIVDIEDIVDIEFPYIVKIYTPIADRGKLKCFEAIELSKI
ncbi:MAG: hypothetical protein RR359_05905 [Bacilli bacterium]